MKSQELFEIFAREVNDALWARGLTRSDLGRMTGYGTNVSRLLNGNALGSVPTLRTLAAVATALGMRWELRLVSVATESHPEPSTEATAWLEDGHGGELPGGFW